MSSTATTSVPNRLPARRARRARRAVRPDAVRRGLVGSHPSRRHPAPSPRPDGYSLTDSSVSKEPRCDPSTSPALARRSSGRGPCPAAGTPTRLTTPSRSTPSSAGSGSAPAAPTTSPRRARTSRHRRRPAGAGRARRRRRRCGRSSTSAATAARRWPTGLRPGAGAVLPVPRLGLPPRRLAGPGRRRRHAGRVRPGRARAAAGAGDDVRPLGAGQRRSGRRAVRPRSARRRPRSVRARRPRARRADAVRAGLQLEGPARELLRELPHAVHPLAAADRRLRVPDRVRRAGGDRLGPPAARHRTRRSRRCTTTGPASPAGPRSPTAPADDSFNNGTYLAVFPNTAISCFAGFAATFRLVPTGPSTTLVEREYYWHPSVPAGRRAADLAATREVVEQDLRMCELLQRHLRRRAVRRRRAVDRARAGVAHVHQLSLAALADADGLTVASLARRCPRRPAPASPPSSGAARSSTPRTASRCAGAARAAGPDVADELDVSTRADPLPLRHQGRADRGDARRDGRAGDRRPCAARSSACRRRRSAWPG